MNNATVQKIDDVSVNIEISLSLLQLLSEFLEEAPSEEEIKNKEYWKAQAFANRTDLGFALMTSIQSSLCEQKHALEMLVNTYYDALKKE